jgi:Pectinacetylesterase
MQQRSMSRPEPATRRRVTLALAAMTAAGLLGACGSGGSGRALSTTSVASSSTSTASSTTSVLDLSADQQAEFQIAAKFARCIRDHGIQGFPDPQLGENGFMLVGAPWRADAEKWNVAQEACQPGAADGTSPNDTAAGATWQRIVPGRDCQCSDGSEFTFFVHKDSPEKVILYLEDGGACFSADTCAPKNQLYHTRITEGPAGEGGIFDFANKRNPFARYSVVYVPYCTGDVHLGNVTTEYAPGLTVHHKGYVNGTAALDYLAATLPGATEVVVIGESAGSVAAPLYAGLVSDRFPKARITALADGSGAYPDLPAFNRLLAFWGAVDALPAWPENAGRSELWSVPGLSILSARHSPKIVFARHDYAYDKQQESWFPRLGVPAGDLSARMDANENRIESAGVNQLSYVAPGVEHTVFTEARFYRETVNGQSLVDWVTKVVAGQPVKDVHCTKCTAG